MREPRLYRMLAATAVAAIPWGAHAVTFEGETVSGDFTSTISSGFGVRTKSPSASFITPGNSAGIPGTASSLAGIGDQGDLNYGKGDPFTTFLKGSHELVLKFPEEITFMGRFTWLRDFAATRTTGIIAANSLAFNATGTDGLTDDARADLRSKVRLMDLWVSKSFTIGDQQARVRVGNQVISWGESLFIPGGINQTNAIDLMRISQPGTQLKEAVLPAPIVSFATGLGNGLNLETYVQPQWNHSDFAPVGSYWSTIYVQGKGSSSYGNDTIDPKKSGQWGTSLRWQPQSIPANFGAYVMNYTDKTPEFSVANFATNGGRLEWTYPTDRKMYGLSVNAPVGDWAVGSELSYRPKDAVSLNYLGNGCAAQGGNCWVDEQRWQWHLTGLLSLTPSNARGFLNAIGASGATFLAELAVIRYPGLKSNYGGSPVAAGGWGWGNETDPTAAPVSAGTPNSSGVALDFSVVYDGTIIPGWQVTPEIFYSRSLSGRTPNLAATFMKGAQSANLMVTFAQSSLKWQFGLNYAKFWGGSSVFDQPLRDRDYFGAYASYNF